MITKVKNYFISSIQELKKVIWPTRQEATKHTILVIVISIAVAAFLGAFDYLFNLIIERII